MAYDLFRKLCDSLEIRANSAADRDRRLYERLEAILGMGTTKPRAFFAAHPEISDAGVLAAFLKTLEPFSNMLEAIFQVCSRSDARATGGHDLVLRYGPEVESLTFDVTAFLEYRQTLSYITASTLQPRYHTDFIPGYGHWLEWLENQSRFPASGGPSLEGDVNPGDLERLIERARTIGRRHLEVLRALRIDTPFSPEALSRQLRELGVTWDHEPNTEYRLSSWRDNVIAGFETFEGLTAASLMRRFTAQVLLVGIRFLERVLSEIAIETSGWTWQEAVERWLSLPYWRKRWQVYEVWVFSVCLDHLFRAGGAVFDPELPLRTGAAGRPLAELRFGGLAALELWFEYPLHADWLRQLRPDIAYVLRYGTARTLIAFVECKQRASESAAAILSDAAKYLPFVPEGSRHLVVNYDPLLGITTQREQRNGTRVLSLHDQVFPGGAGESALHAFVRDLCPVSSLIVFVVDTTESMTPYLTGIKAWIAVFAKSVTSPTAGLLILYGDHSDVYIVKPELESHDLAYIGRRIESVQRTSGGDEAEALEDALHFVGAELERRGTVATQLFVFTDAPPHLPDECPSGYDFRGEIPKLRRQRVEVAVVACGYEEPDSPVWTRGLDVRILYLESGGHRV